MEKNSTQPISKAVTECAGGIATLWEAVVADVGAALLAILNAARIQRTNV